MKLSKRKQQILNFIRNYQAREGYSPSVREICHALDLASPGSLMKHLQHLEKEGFLTRTPGKKRTWKTLGPNTAASIPLLGTIAAGAPISALENREADLPIASSLFGCDETFALRVQGDSMIDAHIMDGDLAIIRPQNDVESGRIAAVMVEGLEPEATLKVLHRKAGRLELHAANEAYSPLLFEEKEQERVRILGRLVGVIRSQT